MKKLTAAVLFFLLLSGAAMAQTTFVTGSVSDTTNKKPVANAVITLLTPRDSVFYSFTRSGADGSFSLKGIAPGKYILMVTQPLFADYVDDIELGGSNYDLKTIPVTPKSKLLQEVIVKSGGAMRIKGDTVSYTADSFKVSANANVEELLKKLPGIQVDKNGQIKAMGEKVEKVLVDGEEFFGDDPGMAVKNLRADAVKEVQVFDKKSEQSEFTGIDDGKTQKTINLKLKEDKKHGYFGKIDLSGGLQKKIDNRYNNNVMLNAFKGKRKIAGYLLQGNTGQDGLNWQDQQKFGGDDDNMQMGMDEDGGGMFMSWSRGSDEDPYIDTRNGFFENMNIGGQYTNKWNDKKTLNFSPKFNRLQYSNIKSTISQLQFGDSLYNTDATENTFAYKRSFKNSFSYDVKIDSVNSLKITTRANFYHNRSTVDKVSENRSKTGTLNNSSEQVTENTADKFSFSNSVLFRHKFKKARRTLSVNADFSLLNNEGLSFLRANNIINRGGGIFGNEIIDQKKDNETRSSKISSKVVYTEPLSKKYSIEFNYEFSYNKGTNNNSTLSQTIPGSGKYDLLVDSLTNNFDQAITTNKTGFKLSFKDKKIKYNLGASAGFTSFDLKDLSFNKDYHRNFVNLFPSAGFTYTYKANHAFNINYSGRTVQPSINQLQQLRNNNNPLNEYIGNPLLKQSFRHNFDISHNTYDFLKDMWTYKSVNVDITSNAITNSIRIDPTSGKTITQPINTNGNYSVNSWMGAGKKLKKLDLFVNLNLSVGYNRFIDIVNDQKNKTSNFNTSLGVRFSKSKDKKYDISVWDDFGYNINQSSVSARQQVKYNTNTIGMDGSVYLKKVWRFATDIEYNYRQQTQDFAENVNNTLWNARVERTFKKDEFTVYASLRDILRQNIGVDRNLNGNGFTEVRNQRLQQYWMVGFKWDFKNKSAKAAAAKQ
jgi:Outer membrane protein beta-barrel family/Carboxypeptidase regulatory-like domain